MGNWFRGLATGLLAACVFAITSCDTRPLRLIIPDFDAASVDGVDVWHVDDTGGISPAGSLTFLEVVVLDAGGQPMEVLTYQMVYPDGFTAQPAHAELVRSATDPDAVDLVLQFDPQAQPGWYRVSTYNAAGSSPLSSDQKYLM